MASIGMMRPSMVAQNFPTAPKFTEKNLPDLAGKVYFVTGANAGVGKELTHILYAKNAVVYMACRSEAKCQATIDEITATVPGSTGQLHYIHIDLGDLRTVKPAAEAFLARESRLNVLFNNAGVMLPPSAKATTVQGFDLQLGTNTVAPFLLTQLLTPVLAATAKAEPQEAAVRVVWVASMAAELYSEHYGLDPSNLRGTSYTHPPSDPLVLYGNSKAASYLHSVEYARRHRDDGIVSTAVNPGNLDSDLYRTVGGSSSDQSKGAKPQQEEVGLGFLQKISLGMFRSFMLHPPVYGAYTELFAGLSPEVTLAKSGSWSRSLFSIDVFPWSKTPADEQSVPGVASSTSARTSPTTASPRSRAAAAAPRRSGTGPWNRSSPSCELP